MKKEILEHLLDGEYDLFQQELAAFLGNSTRVADLSHYSYLPSMLDGWLISSMEKLDFRLHKLFQPGNLLYDITTYLFILKGGNALLLTLTNVHHRDQEAQKEATRRRQAETSLNLMRRPSIAPHYESSFEEYTNLLKSKFTGTKLQQNAQAAWYLAQDRMNYNLDRLVNLNAISYVGIANIKGVLAIKTGRGFRRIYDNMNQGSVSTENKLINEIKDSLLIKKDVFHYKTLETFKIPFTETTTSESAVSYSDKNFKKMLENILNQHSKTSGLSGINDYNLHAAVIGCLLSEHKKLDIKLRPGDETDEIPRTIDVYSQGMSKESKQLKILRLKTATDKMSIESKPLEKINLKRYKFIFDYYDNYRVEEINIFAIVGSSTEVMLEKRVASIPLPKKSERTFTRLLAKGSYKAFVHNLNLYIPSVMDLRSTERGRPELPSLFIGLLLEGALKDHIKFYAQEMTYQNYGFLIESNINQNLILLTNANSDESVESMLEQYAQKIQEVALIKEGLSCIDILQIQGHRDQVYIEISERRINSLTALTSDHPYLAYDRNLLAESSFGHLLKELIHHPDIDTQTRKFQQHIESLVLKKRNEIFPNEQTDEAYIRASVLGFIADSWEKLYALESSTASMHAGAYLYITPENEDHGLKRKVLGEVPPRSLIFKFIWDKTASATYLESLANSALMHVSSYEQLSDLSNHIFHNKDAAIVVLAASENSFITRMTPKITDEGLLDVDAGPARKKQCFEKDMMGTVGCRQFSQMLDKVRYESSIHATRARLAPGRRCFGSSGSIAECQWSANMLSKRMHSDLEEFLNLHSDQYFAKIEKKLHETLLQKGINENLLKIFRKKVADYYKSFGDAYLENHYRYLIEDSVETNIRQHKKEFFLKLGRWFDIITLYGLLDNVVTLRQNIGFTPTFFVSADLLETMSIWLSQCFSDFSPTSKIGLFFNTLATNPITRTVSYFGSLYQFGSNMYSLTENPRQSAEVYYWTARGLQQSTAIFGQVSLSKVFSFDKRIPLVGRVYLNKSFHLISKATLINKAAFLGKTVAFAGKMALKLNPYLLSADIMVSMVSHIQASLVAVSEYENHLPLTSRDRWEIGLKYFSAMDLSHYDLQNGFKQQLSAFYDYLRTELNNTSFRAIVFYADTLIKREVTRRVKYAPPFSSANCPMLEKGYHLLEGSLRSDAIFNLTSLSSEIFLPTSDFFLGLPSDTEDCLKTLFLLCNASVFGFEADGWLVKILNSLEILQLVIKPFAACKHSFDSSYSVVNNTYCARYQRAQRDKIMRSVKSIDGLTLPLIQQPQIENRFRWASAPLGDLQSVPEKCEPFVGRVPAREYCADSASKCEQRFIFSNSTPFILVDTSKEVHGFIRYDNAPSPTIDGVKTSRLHVIQSNPAVIYVGGGHVAYNGSEKFSNIYFLTQNSGIYGYLQGGNKADALLVIGNVTGELSLKFTNRLTTISNKTLEAIYIENYRGSENLTETIEIDDCGLRKIDAKGSQGVGDKFTVSAELRCTELDQEYREVYSGDIHHLASHKPVRFNFRVVEVPNPVFFIKSNRPSIYPQIVTLDVNFFDLRILSLSINEETLYGPSYEIQTAQGITLLKSNAYEGIQYQALNGPDQVVVFFVKIQKPMDVVCEIRSQSRKMALKGFNIMVYFKPKKNHFDSRQAIVDWMDKCDELFSSLLKRITVNDLNFGFFQRGSACSDYFVTSHENVIYEFTGGEGEDVYQILANENCLVASRNDSVFINNKASFIHEIHGQDILDLSPFEDCISSIILEEPDNWEKHRFKHKDQSEENSVVLNVIYECSLHPKRMNAVRIYLNNYNSISEDFRHLLIRLSNYYDVLYRLDRRSKELVPSYHPPNYVASYDNPWEFSKFTPIPLYRHGYHSSLSDWLANRSYAPLRSQRYHVPAGRQVDPLYLEMVEPKIKPPRTFSKSEENSYFHRWVPSLGWVTSAAFVTGLAYKFFSHLRTMSAKIYSPITTIETTALVTATTTLLNKVEATYTYHCLEPLPLSYFTEFSSTQNVSREKSPFRSNPTVPKLNQGVNLFPAISFFSEAYRKKSEQKFKKADVDRKVRLCWLQHKQLQRQLSLLVDKFIEDVNIKFNSSEPFKSSLFIDTLLKQLERADYKIYLRCSISNQQLKAQIKWQAKAGGSLDTFRQWLSELWFESVYEKHKCVPFSGIESLAENQKKAMLTILPVIMQNEDDFINSLSFRSSGAV